MFLEFLTEVDGNNSVDLSKKPKVRAFLFMIEKQCKVTKPYYLAKANEKGETYKLRSFNCAELDRIFTYIGGPKDVLNLDDFDQHTDTEDLVPAIDGEDDPMEYELEQEEAEDNDALDASTEDVHQEETDQRNHKLEFVEMFRSPGNEQTTEIFCIILTEFFQIYNLIKSFNNCQKENIGSRPIDIDQLQLRLKRWLRVYLKLGFKKSITPYMHIFVSHTCTFLLIHYDLNSFNCQGLERLNQQLRQFYRHASNHHPTSSSSSKSSAIRQVVEKQKRFELFQFLGIE